MNFTLLYSNLALVTIAFSLITAIFIFLIDEDHSRFRAVVNLLGSFVKLGLLSLMAYGLYHGDKFSTVIPLFNNQSIVLNADPLAMMFAVLSGGLWLVTTIYAIGYLASSPDRTRFFGFFGLCVFSSIGVSFSGNLLTFLIFYEVLTLSTYPLITHRGSPEVIKAGKIYLVYTLSGGVVLLIGTIFLYNLTGTTSFDGGESLSSVADSFSPLVLKTLFWVLIIGVGVKAVLFPLHGWLPIAMVAPAPVSALLHAVAVVKAGAFGVIRIVYDVFGVNLFSNILDLSLGLVALSCFTILYGSIRALFQNDIKKRLAYSTVSQLSYITLGVAMAGPISTIGGLVHLIHQGIMKITLFFCAGNFAEVLNIKKIEDLNGIARKMPITMACFTIASFGMIGLPPIAGFFSKWFLATGAIEANFHFVMLVLILSSVLNSCYFLPLIYRAYFIKPKSHSLNDLALDNVHWDLFERNTSLWLLIPPVITTALAILCGIFASHPMSPVNWAIFVATEIYLL